MNLDTVLSNPLPYIVGLDFIVLAPFAVAYVVMTRRQAPVDLRIGTFMTAATVVGIVDALLLSQWLPIGALFMAAQSVMFGAVGLPRLVRGIRGAEVVQH